MKSPPEETIIPSTPPCRQPTFQSENESSGISSPAVSLENLQNWKEEASKKGMTLEAYMEELSTNALESTLESHMKSLAEAADGENESKEEIKEDRLVLLPNGKAPVDGKEEENETSSESSSDDEANEGNGGESSEDDESDEKEESEDNEESQEEEEEEEESCDLEAFEQELDALVLEDKKDKNDNEGKGDKNGKDAKDEKAKGDQGGQEAKERPSALAVAAANQREASSKFATANSTWSYKRCLFFPLLSASKP